MSSQSERSDDIDIDISSDTEVEKDDKRKTIDFFINDNNEKVFKCKYCSQKYSHKTSKPF
jgi:aspartate carbamoyltransferase regulatory subunit